MTRDEPPPYTDAEAAEAWLFVNRYGPSNSWTATGGTAARMIGRLLRERERLLRCQPPAVSGAARLLPAFAPLAGLTRSVYGILRGVREWLFRARFPRHRPQPVAAERIAARGNPPGESFLPWEKSRSQ